MKEPCGPTPGVPHARIWPLGQGANRSMCCPSLEAVGTRAGARAQRGFCHPALASSLHNNHLPARLLLPEEIPASRKPLAHSPALPCPGTPTEHSGQASSTGEHPEPGSRDKVLQSFATQGHPAGTDRHSTCPCPALVALGSPALLWQGRGWSSKVKLLPSPPVAVLRVAALGAPELWREDWSCLINIFLLFWYRLISHRISPRAVQMQHALVALLKSRWTVSSCVLMPRPWFPAVKTCKHHTRADWCPVCMFSSGSWQTVPRKSSNTLKVPLAEGAGYCPGSPGNRHGPKAVRAPGVLGQRCQGCWGVCAGTGIGLVILVGPAQDIPGLWAPDLQPCSPVLRGQVVAGAAQETGELQSLVCFLLGPNVAADAPLLPKCLIFFLNLPEFFPSVLSHYCS